MSLLTQKAAFVFRWFTDRTHGHSSDGHYHPPSYEATVTFDDGMAFVTAFAAEFPGRALDVNHTLASARLTKLLRTLLADGWMERWRIGNEIDLPGTPRWQFVYAPPQWLIDDLKNGRITPEAAAEKWGG